MTKERDVILYARYSTDRQNPKSCEDQIAAARQYAWSQGWSVIASFEDAGISGAKGRADRTGWDNMLAFIEAGGLAAGGLVLTWDIDRWSRDWADGMIEALRLHKLGINLADTKDGELVQAGLAGKILLTLKVAGSAEFLEKLVRASKRGSDAKRAAGYWTQTPPYGYAIERRPGGSVLVPDPEQDHLVREIFDRVAAGESFPALARDLRARGIRTRRGRPWTPATLRDVCRSPTYLGLVPVLRTRRGGKHLNRTIIRNIDIETFPGQHAPLVDRETWEAAMSRAIADTRTPNRPGRPRPLSGTVVCGNCGRACQVTGGIEPWRYYRCRMYGDMDDSCPSRRTVRIDRLEAAVRELSKRLLDDDAAVLAVAARSVEQEWKRATAAAAARAPVADRVADLERKQERLLAALYEGAAPALVNARLRQIEGELQDARDALDSFGSIVEPMSVAAAGVEIRSALRTYRSDLSWVRTLGAKITIPANPKDKVTISALGRVYRLDT